MTPKEYELYVCDIYSQRGYRTQLTPYSNDYGIDIFALKDEKKIGIQVKMFGHTSRKINRRMIMELHGAKDYSKCHKAILVTDGQLLDSAEEVAKQLGIEIEFIEPISIFSKFEQKEDIFEKIWATYIKPLEGKTLIRDNGKTNKIICVDWSGLERITSNGKSQKIKIEIFRLAINKIISEGSITRHFINQEYDGRASSGIILILSQVPFFGYNKNPSRITLNKEKFAGFKN